MKTKKVKVSHVTQNKYAEKINLGGFFEGFSVTLLLKRGGSARNTSSVEMCMCVEVFKKFFS